MAFMPGTTNPYWLAIASIAIAGLSMLVRALWRNRRLIHEMKKLGKPMPPWNPLLGSLQTAGKLYEQLPPVAHSCYLMEIFAKDFPNGAFYFDVWPAMEPILIITDLKMANQVIAHPVVGARKPTSLAGWMYAITGGPTLFDSNGPEWKRLHNLFSPGFSTTNMNRITPIIADKIVIYRDNLRRMARTGEVFQLEPMGLNLITDVISEALLNIKLDTQSHPHPLSEAMRRQLRMKFTEYAPQNMLEFANPFSRYKTWSNSRLLDSLIGEQLEKRFQAHRSQKAGNQTGNFKSVADLILEDYMSQPGKASQPRLDSGFRRMAIRNMRMFFFNGYDSTASALVYCYYILSKNPHALATLRAEHDSIFGTNLDSVPQQLVEKPALLSSLAYTQAVIKESLRLFPVANCIREGSEDLTVVDDAGNKFPTKGFGIVVSHYCTMRNPKYWIRPTEFLPERWLVEQDHELYPPKGGFRAFEYGTRQCIGQQLVMTNLKAVLLCSVREFNFQECYQEVDGGEKLDLSCVEGHRPYMVDAGSAHPVDKYPCRMSKHQEPEYDSAHVGSSAGRNATTSSIYATNTKQPIEIYREPQEI